MPVVAQNRGWKTGDTSHQYEHIFKRTYQHVIRKGKAAALDPIPEGLGYAYADAYRAGKHDATKNGSSNSRFLLAHRIKRFKDIGVRTQIEGCEDHCRRMAHKWICDVFGAHRAMDPRLGQAGKDMLQRKLEEKYKQLKDKMERTNKWNSFMTDDLRRAENDCLELITDEESRKLVHAELETARAFIGDYWTEERRKALEKAAMDALQALGALLSKFDEKVKVNDIIDKYETFIQGSIVSQQALDKYAADIGKAAGVAVDAESAENWPDDNQTQFYSKDIIDNYIDTIFKMDVSKLPWLMTKFQELGFLYTVLTEYRRKVLEENNPKNKPTRPKAKPKRKNKKAAAIKNAVASMRQMGKNRSELIAADKLFDAVDTNKNNFIEKSELLKALRTNKKAKILFQSTKVALRVFDHWPQDTKISRDKFIYILYKDTWENWKLSEVGKSVKWGDKAKADKAEAETEAEKQRQAKKAKEKEEKKRRAEAEREKKEAEKQRQAKEAKAKEDRRRQAEAERRKREEEKARRQAKKAADRAAKEAEAKRLAEKAKKAAERTAKEAEAKRLAEEAKKQRLAKEAEQRKREEEKAKRLAKEAEAKRLAKEAEAKRLVEMKRQRVDAARERLKTSQQPSRQQEIRNALKTSMDEANKALAVTIDQLFAEPQKSNHCLQHSINNVIGKALFTESDFYNEQDGGYVKTELDRLLKDKAQHKHRIHPQWFRERNRVFDRLESDSGLKVPVLSKEELTLLVSGREDLLGFIVHTTKAGGHWVAVKRVTVGDRTVFVEIDSIGPANGPAITQVAENVAQLHAYLTTAPRDGDTVDAIFAMSEYEYLEHEAEEIMSPLQFVLNYTLNFVRHSDKNKDRRILEYAVLIVDKDGFKEDLTKLDQSARERVARLLRQADDLLQEQSYDEGKLVKSAMRALVDEAALPSSSSDAQQQKVAQEWEKVDPIRVAEDLGDALDAWTAQASSSLPSGTSSGTAAAEVWRELTGDMEAALERGWEMFENWQRAAQRRVDAESSADLIAALPELPFREEPMPTPLQFFDFADFAVDAEAPPSPPRVMLR